MEKINYKLQMLLALIPFFGCPIVIWLATYQIKKANNSLIKALLYFLLTAIVMFAIFGVVAVIYVFAIRRIEELWLLITLSLIISLLAFWAVAYSAIGLEKLYVKTE